MRKLHSLELNTKEDNLSREGVLCNFMNYGRDEWGVPLSGPYGMSLESRRVAIRYQSL